MAISSMDDIIAALTAGRTWRQDFNKISPLAGAMTAGVWYDLSGGIGGGNPMVDAIVGSGTNLSMTALSDTTSTTATTAATSGSISTTTFTDTTHGTGRFTVGSILSGTNVVAGTYITALGTGTGANNGGTYTVNISQTVTSQTITGTQYSNGIYHGGDVSGGGYVKHLLNASFFSGAATSAPAIALLIDKLATVPLTTVTSTSEQAVTSVTLPRYADGKGVMAYAVNSIVTGAGTPTFRIKYTNSDNTDTRWTPATPNLPTLTASTVAGPIPYSGTGAGKMGPFLPLQAGDKGIKSVESIQLSATATSGVMNLVLCKPLAVMPITTVGVACERDFLNQIPSLPRIYDGANLHWLIYAGAAIPTGTSYFGHIDTVWG